MQQQTWGMSQWFDITELKTWNLQERFFNPRFVFRTRLHTGLDYTSLFLSLSLWTQMFCLCPKCLSVLWPLVPDCEVVHHNFMTDAAVSISVTQIQSDAVTSQWCWVWVRVLVRLNPTNTSMWPRATSRCVATETFVCRSDSPGVKEHNDHRSFLCLQQPDTERPPCCLQFIHLISFWLNLFRWDTFTWTQGRTD